MKKKRNDKKSSLQNGDNAIKCVVVGDGTVGSLFFFLFYFNFNVENRYQ